MIHYHGTPIGGSRQDVARFLAGRHALVPFPRQDDMGVVGEVCKTFVFDNGAGFGGSWGIFGEWGITPHPLPAGYPAADSRSTASKTTA